MLREAQREVKLAKAAVSDRRPGASRRYLLALALESSAQAQAVFAVRPRGAVAEA